MTSDKKILWLVYLLYVVLSGYTIAHHELWGDEVHSWNIAKGSGTYTQLIENRKYEGHPPAWYTILWSVSKFTHNTAYMQAAQWVIACLVAGLIIFYSPFPVLTRALLPFGYYFIFEYAVLSRNYALGILFAFCLCLIIRREFRYKLLLYYGLLFCLSNTHLLSLLLAASLHLYFLLFLAERREKKSALIFHVIAGMLMLLPAVYFIFPPSDGEENIHFWLDRWTVSHVTDLLNAPLRAFLPLPAWWNYHFWDTQFLLEPQKGHSLLKFIVYLLSLSFLVITFIILRKNKKSLTLFTTSLLFSGIFSLILLPMTSARHAGFIFLGFITAAWLYCYETPLSGNKLRVVNALLLLQLLAGGIAVVKDIRYPFSNFPKVAQLIQEVPAGKKWTTDYWTANAVIAFTDRPVYCVDLQKEVSFIVWDKEMAVMQNSSGRYTKGIRHLFRQEGINTIYMITQNHPDILPGIDPQLSGSFNITLIDKREGAIENGSNLYLYRITNK